MEVTGFKHRVVSVPVKYPVVSSVRQSDEILFVLLDVFTNEGIKGISYAQAFHPEAALAIKSCLELLEKKVVGENPFEIEKLWFSMWNSIKLLGHQGLATFSLSMIDIALWDIKAKALNIPVYELLGGKQRDSFEVYNSDGMWLVSPKEAAEQAEEFVRQGYSSIKMRLGRHLVEDDIQAVTEVRNAVGENIEVMADVNQGWNVEKTLLIGKKLIDYNLAWLEEPIEAEDVGGYAKLKTDLEIPVACGENLYSIRPFKRFMEKNAGSILTPDLQRIGGISGWKRLSALFETDKIPFSLHLFPEFSSQIFATVQTSEKLEWMSWASSLFVEPLECMNGKVKVKNEPGFGLAWNEEFISSIEK